MRQTSGITFFRSFSDTLARAFRWQKPSVAPHLTAPALAAKNPANVRVLSAPQPWLQELGWDKIVSFNQSQCQLQNTQTTPNRSSYDAARQFWEGFLGQPLSLVKALSLCKDCHDRSPFVFSNSSTFCLAAKAMVEALAKDLPPVEAHIVRNTAANYVAGRVSKRELIQILRVYESKWCMLAPLSSNGHVEKPPNA